MTERVVSSAWWLIVMAFIVASAVACVMLGYQGLLHLIAQRWMPGAVSAITGVLMGVTSLLFCRHRTDLLA